MCGIFGHVGPIDQASLHRCLRPLQHRGPDSTGVWHTPEISFGHQRLAILDLSDLGKQPMSFCNERYWITYNGEIYNFLELRKDLEAEGRVFKTQSDTEVILAAFSEWGEKCLDRFNGMWAFAIWDGKEKALFLARDRFGKKPLFYASLPSGFAFASEMKALFPLFDQVRPNQDLLRDGSRIFSYETTDECLVQGIRRFPAGTLAWYKNGKLSLRRWWDTLDHLVQVPSSYPDQVEQFRELFIDACRIRMRSDVPLGTALSGGLDSSCTLAALAHAARTGPGKRSSSDWQHAFVATFPGTPLDEAGYAKMMTDHLGIQATFIEIDPLKVIDKLYEHLYLFEELYITPPIPFMLTYGAMRAQGITVTLDGHGADECFGGYDFDYLSALRDAGLNLRQIRMILSTRYASFPKDSSQFPLPSPFLFWIQWHLARIAKNLLNPGAFLSKNIQHPNWKRLDHLTRRLYLSAHHTILPTILRNYDRYSMANGVEIRMPFMDYRIVTYAFSLPWTSKIRDGYSKSIIRDAMASFLPPAVAYRKSKIGFNSPIVDWMKGALREFFMDAVHAKSFKECSLINPKEVHQKVRQVIDDPDATFQDAQSAWTMLSPYLWECAMLSESGKTK